MTMISYFTILDYLVMEIELHGVNADARFHRDGVMVIMYDNPRQEEFVISDFGKPLSVIAKELVEQFKVADDNISG